MAFFPRRPHFQHVRLAEGEEGDLAQTHRRRLFIFSNWRLASFQGGLGRQAVTKVCVRRCR